jgi:probable rRNA maturation factor
MMNTLLPNIVVSVQIDLPEECLRVGDYRWFQAAVRHGLVGSLPAETRGQIGLLLTDDTTVRELNREYRGVDRTTDVLSFSFEHWGHWEGKDDAPWSGDDAPEGWPLPEDEPPPLGEIIVSVPQAARQAEGLGVPLRRELALLIVHGALHLLGHDHYDDGEREAMQALERVAMAALFGEG